MANQIEFQLPKRVWQEGSAFEVPVYFRTRASAAASTPTTVHYRVDCLSTGKELQGLTSVSAGASVTILVTAAHNAIQSDCNDYERKQLTIVLDQGLSTQFTKAVSWEIENLFGTP